MLHIKTPATTANLGCGFDSIGMALKLYNELWIEETDGRLEINLISEHRSSIPLNENNLIYRTIKDFYSCIGKKAPNVRMYQKDCIPMTRGLGSSAACIVSGILAANALSRAKKTSDELLRYAARIEGHPDNAAPAMLGGIVVGAMNEKELRYVRLETPKDLRFAAIIPSFSLSTEKARKLLPKMIPHKDAVFNASRAGLLIASLIEHRYDNLHMALDDRLHQPYRKEIIPDFENIFKKAKEYGARGVFLSGAGPTIIAVLSKNESFEHNMENYLRPLKGGWVLNIMDADDAGATVDEGCLTSEE